jgi:hypothetical protein
MKNDILLQSVQQAIEAFEFAENEINRPNEDTVPLCACHSTRESIIRFMQTYLLSKSVFYEGNNINRLKEQCARFDPEFNNIDVSCFKCSMSDGIESHYCLSIEKVHECFDRAKEVKGMVLEHTKIISD